MNMQVYGGSARFDHQQRALSEDDLRKLAPSIFATSAHESRSERFRPIPTIEVIRAMAKEGLAVVGARQARCRQEGRADYTKHLLRIRHIDGKQHQVGDTVFEALLKNANDGTCQYELMAGLFRIQCLNSLVAMETAIETIKVRHTGTVAQKVIEGTYNVIDNAPKALEAPDKWSRIMLDTGEQQAFAEAAHSLRFDDPDSLATQAIKPAALLSPRRSEDNGNDLWRTFNRVQENAIRGNLRGTGRDANNRVRNVTTRPVKGIDQDVKLNRALFTLAAKMAELKAA